MGGPGRSVLPGLTAAKLCAGRCLRLDRELGALEPGKWADFVVLDASPLTDMRNIRKQHSVWIGGAQVKTRGR